MHLPARRARSWATTLALALASTWLVALPSAPASAQAPDGLPAEETRRLQATSDAPVEIVDHEVTGAARLVGAAPGASLGRPAGVAPTDPPEQAAAGFLAEHQAAFGLTQADRQLRPVATTPAADGVGETVRFQQDHRGVPVLGAELVVRTDETNRVLSVAGETLPAPDVDVTARVPAREAADRAVAALARRAEVATGGLVTDTPRLAVFDPAVFGGPEPAGGRLVWQFEVRAPADPTLHEYVLVDADRGGIVLSFSLVHDAAPRRVCDNASALHASSWDIADCGTDLAVTRVEGDTATTDAEVDAAYDFSGGFRDMLQSVLGRDSLDGAGMALKSTVNWCFGSCPYRNAFWSGSQMYYGTGYAVDDVVGHELAHGLTQHTAELFYYYQSGAINESLSDLYGEALDLRTGGDDDAGDRWLIGEQLPGGPIRDMADPTALGDPDRIGSPRYAGGTADGGGVHTNSGVNNKAAALLVDGGTFNGRTVTGIGLTRTLRIYYEVQTSLLTSAADYAALADALEQACANLTGGHGITTSTCRQVRSAVAATEMRTEPAGPTTLDAPSCPAGTTDDRVVYREDVEGSVTDWRWSTEGRGWSWGVEPGYATSGDRAFYAPGSWDEGTTTLAMRDGITLPRGAHLRFAHAYAFERGDYDGGVVELSVDGGPWRDAGQRIVANGYTGTIDSGSNPLDGRRAYVDTSGGYTSALLDLDDLAGRSVRVRWRAGTDGVGGALGWLVDDVSIRACRDVVDPAFTGDARLTFADTTATSTRVTWPAAGDNVGVTDHRVVATVDGARVAATTVAGGVRAAVLDGLPAGSTVNVTVRALDAWGNGSAPLSGTATTSSGVAREVARVAGADRYATAAQVSAERFPAGTRTVYVSTGDNFPDALAAGPSAGIDRAPILLVSPSGIPDATAGELTRLAPETIVVLGGAAVVPPAVADALAPYASVGVERVAGDDRYATAVAVSARAFDRGVPVAYVATGGSFPDALAGASAAGRDGGPVLLVGRDTLPEVVARELVRLQPERVVLLGGDAAVSPAVEARLAAVTGAPVTRIGGTDRYDTAARVAATFDAGTEVVHVATGANFPDALTGTPPAVMDTGPILLVPPTELPPSTATELGRLQPRRIVVLGGDGVVSEGLARTLHDYLP